MLLGDITPSRSAPGSLAFLIEELGAEKGCAVLIDEYDKPITEALTSHPDALERNIATLRHFYSVLKSEDSYIKFIFITGVSRFSKVSIFSGINNLEDISFNKEFATICGYTENEIKERFKGYLERQAHRSSMSEDEILIKLREYYNGYQFTESYETVFNPISVLRCFDQGKFKNHWFETATPSFLINRIRQEALPPSLLDNVEGVSLEQEATESAEVSTIELLYQTGYLTIKKATEVDDETIYSLGWPNKEVRQSFYKYLLPYVHKEKPLYAVGVNFSSESRSVKEWMMIKHYS